MAERTESSIDVSAPPPAVLSVVADVESYPEWAGGVKQVEVLSRDADGRPRQARFVVDQGPIKDTYVLEYSWDVAADSTGTVAWTLLEAEIIKRLDGTYLLEADGEGTHVRYQLAVDVKIPMLGMLKRKAEKVIIDTALKDLKKRSEG